MEINEAHIAVLVEKVEAIQKSLARWALTSLLVNITLHTVWALLHGR